MQFPILSFSYALMSTIHWSCLSVLNAGRSSSFLGHVLESLLSVYASIASPYTFLHSDADVCAGLYGHVLDCTGMYSIVTWLGTESRFGIDLSLSLDLSLFFTNCKAHTCIGSVLAGGNVARGYTHQWNSYWQCLGCWCYFVSHTSTLHIGQSFA